jgi:hypothetical protein
MSFVDCITWLFDATHAHIICTRERALLGPGVTRACTKVMVFWFHGGTYWSVTDVTRVRNRMHECHGCCI